MKRPIPEGVTAPEGGVILGRGGDFEIPQGGFIGYAICPGLYLDWDKGYKQGDDDRLIYAADAGSEVARLNEPLLAKFVRTNNEGVTPSVAAGDIEEDPRDGAIRGITTDLERDLLALLFEPKYSDMSLDQIRTLACGYVTQGNNLERTESEIREFITDALKTPRLERR